MSSRYKLSLCAKIVSATVVIYLMLLLEVNNLSSIPIYPLQRVFYPQNLVCTPKNDEVPYMLLYIEGTKNKK